MRTFIFIIPLLFSFAAFAQSGDTLTLKDCDCKRYDGSFDVCSVTISKGQIFFLKSGYIVHELLCPWAFSYKNQVCYKSPYDKHGMATWSSLISNQPICFYTLIFFVNTQKA